MILYDSTNATLIPRDAQAVAGYGDGAFLWSPAWEAAGGLPLGANWWDLFPNAVQLVIVTNPANSGDVLDVETGDATPADVPSWVRRFNRAGRRRPTIYSSRSTWQAILGALASAGIPVSAVDWWAATLDGTQQVAGAVAVQYQDVGPGLYDVSNIQDPTWLGGNVMSLDGLAGTDPNVQRLLENVNDVDWMLSSGQRHGLAFAADGTITDFNEPSWGFWLGDQFTAVLKAIGTLNQPIVDANAVATALASNTAFVDALSTAIVGKLQPTIDAVNRIENALKGA